MIRARAGEREQRFNGVKPAHPLARFTAGGEFTDVIVRVIFAAKKIAVERQNDFGFVVIEHRLHRLAKRLRGRALVNAGINRVVNEPFRAWIFCRENFLQPRTGRRRAAFRKQREAGAAVGRKFLREAGKKT